MMTYLERLPLYLRLFTFTRYGFERQVRAMLEQREHMAEWDRKFFESPRFLEYWREEFRHEWCAVSQEGSMQLGRMCKRDALEHLARVSPHLTLHYVDEVRHFLLFTQRPHG